MESTVDSVSTVTKLYTHTHTLTYIYIYIYACVCERERERERCRDRERVTSFGRSEWSIITVAININAERISIFRIETTDHFNTGCI